MAEYNEDGGATTITFQRDSDNVGFQIFVKPYGQRQVGMDTFKSDEPSGAIIQPQDVTIDNARATMFYGNNTIIGDTCEASTSEASTTTRTTPRSHYLLSAVLLASSARKTS